MFSRLNMRNEENGKMSNLNATGDERSLQDGLTQRHVGQEKLLGAFRAQLLRIRLVFDAQKIELNGSRIGHDYQRVLLRHPLTRLLVVGQHFATRATRQRRARLHDRVGHELRLETIGVMIDERGRGGCEARVRVAVMVVVVVM